MELHPELVSFSANGRGKPLVFALELPLLRRIVTEGSSWSFEGRGQLTFSLQKEENETWAQLSPPDDGATRRGAVTTWHEMQETLDREKPKPAPKPPADKPPAPATTPATPAATPAAPKKSKAAKRAQATQRPPDGWWAWLQWKARGYYRTAAAWLRG